MSEAKEKLVRVLNGEMTANTQKIADAIEALIDERTREIVAQVANVRAFVESTLNPQRGLGSAEPPVGGQRSGGIQVGLGQCQADPRCGRDNGHFGMCRWRPEPQPSSKTEGAKRECVCLGEGYCAKCRDQRFGVDRKCHRSHPHSEPCPDEPEPPTPPSAGPIAPSKRPQAAANIRALASCIRDGLLNKRSRDQYDEQTIAEMIAAAVDAVPLNATASADGGRTVAEALHSLDCCPIHEDFWRKCPDSCVLFKSVAAYEDGAALPTVACDTERFDWFFGPANKIEAMGEYFVGVQNKWSLGEWRAFCDRWMNAARAAEGKS